MADSPRKKQEYQVVIVGREGLLNELLSSFLEQSKNPLFNCSLQNSISSLDIKKTKSIENLVLLNCHDLNEYDKVNACARHISSVPEGCYCACFNVPDDQKLAENAISNGVHGIFYDHDSLENLERGLNAIVHGELWFSRDTLSATLSSLVERNSITSSTKSSDTFGLTKREKEILKLIALGKTNDEIADRLSISTLTVKTHVSNIYRKINVPNRIQAIFWATKNVVHLKD